MIGLAGEFIGLASSYLNISVSLLGGSKIVLLTTNDLAWLLSRQR